MRTLGAVAQKAVPSLNAQAARACLLNDLISPREERRRHIEPERPGGLQIDHHALGYYHERKDDNRNVGQRTPASNKGANRGNLDTCTGGIDRRHHTVPGGIRSGLGGPSSATGRS